MNQLVLQEHFATCPYCGETISLLVDYSLSEQCYIEDCEVCCRPITIRIRPRHAGDAEVRLFQENDIA